MAAPPDLLPGHRIAWLYTSESGTVYRVTAMKAYTDQAKLGGSVATGFETELPRTIKMRRITLSTVTGHSRTVPVYAPGAPIIAAAATLIVNRLGVSEVMTSHGGLIGERDTRVGGTHQTA